MWFERLKDSTIPNDASGFVRDLRTSKSQQTKSDKFRLSIFNFGTLCHTGLGREDYNI